MKGLFKGIIKAWYFHSNFILFQTKLLRLRALFARRGNSARDKLVFEIRVTDAYKSKLFLAVRAYSFS